MTYKFRYITLRAAVLIGVLGAGFAAAQVDPPDLRCLEVTTAGNVVLTWVPPADPANEFVGYEIWASISRTSGYASVTPLVVPVSTFTFAHAAPTASVQSWYYYVKTRYTGGVSQSSDTLRSIFLNVFPGTADLQLIYNHVRMPPPATTFTITKDFPPGTLNTLAVTPATQHADTINVCNARISYQVNLADEKGCVSKSNIITGDYVDTKDPDSTSVDSISVLPDGRTVLGWRPPRDEDVVKYFLIEFAGNTNSYIDSVNGRATTIYTYQPFTALEKPVALFVSAYDQCAKIGPFDETPRTMYLESDYDVCAYTTTLRWTPYPGMKGGLLEYRIYYSVEGGPFQVAGTTTLTTFTHEPHTASNVSYFIRAVNRTRKITSSSNRIAFFTRQSGIPEYMYLSSASVINNIVEVSLLIDNTKAITALELERSIDSVDFVQVATLPGSGSLWYTFYDESAEPSVHSYVYRVRLRDSCGNQRVLSNAARTVKLTVDSEKEGLFTYTLHWNAYEGFSGGTSGYNIYRMIDGKGNHEPIATTGPFTRTYTDNIEDSGPEGALVEYVVQAIEGLGNPFGIRSGAYSNVVPVYTEGRLFVPNAFTPSGLNPVWKPVTHFVSKSDYRVTVYDRWGKEVFYSLNPDEGWDGAGYPPGSYTYVVSYRNARGEYREVAGHIALIR